MVALMTDDPPSAEQLKLLADAFALQQRMGRVGRYVNEGHIVVEALHGSGQYRVECGGHLWSELQRDFPSEATIAKIELAIHAGATGTEEERAHRRARKNAADAMGDAYRYGNGFAKHILKSHVNPPTEFVWLDEMSEIKEDVYARVADMTRVAGKLTPANTRKLTKGLRP